MHPLNAVRDQLWGVLNNLTTKLTVAAVLIATLATSPGVRAQEQQPCTYSGCTSYCYNNPQSVCQFFQPGCFYSGYDCTWWTWQCGSPLSYKFTCNTGQLP